MDASSLPTLPVEARPIQDAPATLVGAASTPPTRPPASDGRPISVAGYLIERELGRGGMGVVYQALQVSLNRTVALKMILTGEHAGPSSLERFRTEAEAIARLQHPNIVQIYEVGQHEGLPYFSLEYCPGGNLDRKLNGTPMVPREAAQLVEILARAINSTHDRGIVHRDLKPANVLLGEDGTPKVTDFGLAKKLDESARTASGAIVGTPSYMAPEQAGGEKDVGPACDVYALGAILYECLTGRPPFKAATAMDTLMQVIAIDPVSPRILNAQVPRDLGTICLKCLEKRAPDRYLSAQALADDLQLWLEGKPIHARPASAVERAIKWLRRSPAQAASIASGLAFIVAVFVGVALQLRAALKEEEANRRDALRHRFGELYTRAEQAAEAGEEGTDWGTVERELRVALELAEAEPGSVEAPLHERARSLLARAEGHIAASREQAELRAQLLRLQDFQAEAATFAILYFSLGELNTRDRAIAAIDKGLALFDLKPDGEGLLNADPRFVNAVERGRIIAVCQELLLVKAHLLANPLVGEKAGEWHARLRQALTLLDRADRLLPGRRTRSGLTMRADFLKKLGETKQAAPIEQEAQATAPELASDYFLIGLNQYNRGEDAEAIVSLGNALNKQPGHFGANYLLAICQFQEEHWHDAKDRLSTCMQQQPNLPWPRLMRAAVEIELAEFDTAFNDINELLEQKPEETAHYIALVNCGVLRLRQNRWADAAKEFESAIAKKPDAVAAYINLALVHRQRSESLFQAEPLDLTPLGTIRRAVYLSTQQQLRLEAVTVLNQGIKLQPTQWRLYHERGRLYLLLELTNEASADFHIAVTLAPNNRHTLSVLANDFVDLGRQQHQQKNHSAAIRAYDVALILNPDQALTYRLKAEPLLSLRRYKQANEALDRYLKSLTPVAASNAEQVRKTVDALKAVGIIYIEQKDYRAAIDTFTQGLRIERDPALLLLRGGAYLMFNAPTLALLDFDEALQLRPDDGNTLLSKADALVKLGRTTEALQVAEQGLQRSPKACRAYYLAARVYTQVLDKLEAERASRTELSKVKDRAFELLRLALDNVPPNERATFWEEYIDKDAGFRSIRVHPEWRTLADEAKRPAK